MVNHLCLSKKGYIIDRSKLNKDEERQIIKDLTVKTTVLPAYADFQKPEIYKIYYFNEQTLYLPRFYGLEKFGVPTTISIPRGIALDPSIKCHNSPLPHQATAIEKIHSIFDKNKQLGDGGVLSLPCGYGKTYCAIYTACHIGYRTLIVVPTECLMDQWADAIRQFTNATVGTIQRDKVDTDHDFVVAMLQSISLKNYPPETFSQFGFLVIDECHHICSKSFSKALLKVRTRFTLGLSATPNRRDGLSHVFYKFIGPLFHTEKRTNVNQVVVKKITCTSSHQAYEILKMSNGTKNTSGMTTAVSDYEERNRMIIHCLKELILQKRKILVLSSRRGHLQYLKILLDQEGIKCPVTGEYATYGFYYGKKGTNRAVHKKLLAESAKCDIILGINTIAKEGLDIPDLNCLVFVTPPGLEVEQPVGRILRKFHKDFNPLVIDIVDKTGNYAKHSTERDSWYTSENYVIHDISIRLSDTDENKQDVWKEGLTEYIHNMTPDKKKRIKITMTKPNLDLCLLPNEKIFVNQEPAKTETAPDLNICYL